jgi:hypothetical protein
MEDTHVLEVVIDDFQFTPNGLMALPDGDTCSKDCHCGPDSMCQNNKCTFVSTGGNGSFRPSRPQPVYTFSNPTSEVIEDPHSGNSQTSAAKEDNAKEDNADMMGGNHTSVEEPSTESSTDMAVSFESLEDGNRSGMKAGVSLLFIALVVTAAIVYIRSRRNKMYQLAAVRRFRKFGATSDVAKNVVVDGNEEATVQESSFEMSVRDS